MMNTKSKYNRLEKEGKLMVQQKISKLMNMETDMETVQLALKKVNPSIDLKADENKIGIGYRALNRVKEKIIDLNRKRYFKNKSKSG